MDSRHRDDLAKGNGLTTYAESVIYDISCSAFMT